MALGGLDIGTSGCKCTIMTDDGKLLASCYREYPASRLSGAHEIEAELIWESSKYVVKTAIAESKEHIQALCVTSFGESCALLDDNDKVLAPVMLYTDPRGHEEVEEINSDIGEREMYKITGLRPNPMYFLPKLLWLRKHNLDLVKKVKRILPINSFIIYHMTGSMFCDYSLASRTSLLDIRKLDWSDKLLELCHIDKDILPKLVCAGKIAGQTTSAVSKLLGIDYPLDVVVGPQDQIAAAIGAGAMKVGMAVNGSGSVECYTPVFDKIPDHPSFFDGGYAIVPALNGLFVTYAFIFTGGVLLQWFRDNLAKKAKDDAEKLGKNVYALLDKQVKQDPSGLLVLPHFAGAATPYMDTFSKGAILGLSVENSEIDIYQALMEGICYESKVNIDTLEKAGIKIDCFRATGGGSNSSVWIQMKADILGKKFTALDVKEAGSLGSIMLAGCAANIFSSIDEASAMVKTKADILPSDRNALYAPLYERYKQVYSAIRNI